MVDLMVIEDYLEECRIQDIEVAFITVDDVSGIITRLRQAEKDAARYRWLRDDADEFDINDFFMCSQLKEKRDAFADEAMQCNK